eukprot:328271-Amphidinium_carterae.1
MILRTAETSNNSSLRTALLANLWNASQVLLLAEGVAKLGWSWEGNVLVSHYFAHHHLQCIQLNAQSNTLSQVTLAWQTPFDRCVRLWTCRLGEIHSNKQDEYAVWEMILEVEVPDSPDSSTPA